MKHKLLPVLFILLSLLITRAASAQNVSVNVSGQWSAEIYEAGDLIANYLWTMKQRPVPGDPTVAAITGAGSAGSFTWTTSGAITEGNQFTKLDTFNASTYTMAFDGQVNGTSDEITGEWVDNLARSGTFIARRTAPEELSPQTKIEDAPAVTIAKKNITITMEKFSKALPKSGRAMLALAALRAKQPKLTIKYEVNVKGATRQQTRTKIVSKKNEITVKKLAPGNYTSTYRVQAFQGEKRVYQSNVSPKATFTIR